jgi:hypothetical protein
MQNSIVIGLSSGDLLRVGSSTGSTPAPVRSSLEARHVVGGMTRLAPAVSRSMSQQVEFIAVWETANANEPLGNDSPASSDGPTGLGAELFRAHRCPVIAIVFVNNNLVGNECGSLRMCV